MTDNTFLLPANGDFPVPVKYRPGRIDDVGLLCGAAGCPEPLIVIDRVVAKATTDTAAGTNPRPFTLAKMTQPIRTALTHAR